MKDAMVTIGLFAFAALIALVFVVTVWKEVHENSKVYRCQVGNRAYLATELDAYRGSYSFVDLNTGIRIKGGGDIVCEDSKANR